MLFIAIASALAALSPAATRADQPVPAADTAAPAAAPRAATRAAKPTKYCIEWNETGLRIPRSECRTREQWLKDGFDPLAKE